VAAAHRPDDVRSVRTVRASSAVMSMPITFARVTSRAPCAVAVAVAA